MSTISNDSFGIDDDNNLITDINEEVDFYAILNVSKDVGFNFFLYFYYFMKS